MFYKNFKIKGLLWPSLITVAAGVCLLGLVQTTSNSTIGHASGDVGSPSNVRLNGDRTSGNLPVIWDAATGSDVKYHITYSDNNGSSWSLGAFAHTTNSITISGVNDDSSYIVGVRAYNDNNSSGWVNSGSIGPLPPTNIQSVVSNVGAITASRTDGNLIVTWGAATGLNVKYHITYSSDSGYTWSLGANNHTGTTLTISGVSNAQTYIVGIRAFNDNSTSGWVNSSLIDAWVQVGTPVNPGRPGLQRTGRGNGTLPIYWQKSTTASATYNVRYATEAAPTTWTTTNNVTTSTCSDGYSGSDAADYVCYEINGVNNATSYYVAVQASNNSLNSDWQQSNLIVPLAAPRTNVRQSGCTGVSTYILVVDWDNHQSQTVPQAQYQIDAGTWTDLDISSTAYDYRQVQGSAEYGFWFHDPDILEKKTTAYDFGFRLRLTHNFLGRSPWHTVHMKAGTDANTSFWWNRCPTAPADDFVTLTRRGSAVSATWDTTNTRYDHDVEVRTKLSTGTQYGSWTRVGTSCWSGNPACTSPLSHSVANLDNTDVQFRMRTREPLAGVSSDWTTYTSLAP